MKHLMAIALFAAGVVLPVCAQRGGGSRGGFSGHSASAFHGGFNPSTHFSYATGAAVGGNRFAGAAPAYRGGSGYLRPTRPLPVLGRGRFYGVARSYGYGGGYGNGWVAPYYLGYPDADVDDSGPTGPANVADDGSQQPYVTLSPDQGPPQPPASYQEAYAPPPARPANEPRPEPEDAVTLIFKDGRSPEQIHNYALTRTMLYVRDQHKRDIPVADLDLAATAKANQNAGVEFQLPTAQ